MFGLFGKKAAPAASTVAAETGAALQAQTALPGEFPAQPSPAFPPCDLAHYRGEPPAAQWAKEEEPGETNRAWRVPPAAGSAPLALVESAQRRMELWELSNERVPAFVKQRTVTLDPAQQKWSASFPQQVACLPGGRVAVAVGYEDPVPRDALFVYNAANNSFRSLGRVEPDTSSGPPFKLFETLTAAPGAILLAYHTGQIRLGPERYAFQLDRIVLFSARYPDGLEVAALAIDNGNLAGWRMQGKTLWLQTVDPRKTPREFIWSLDLSKVL